MKIKYLAISILFLSTISIKVSAQELGISILNPDFIEDENDEKIYYFKQGQTIVVALDDKVKAENPYAWIEALGSEVYSFNRYGLAFVGVSLFTEPGEYSICLFTACHDLDRKNELRVKVVENEFIKTRTARFTGQPKLRRDRQKKIIDKAYALNMASEDLTGGLSYLSPLPGQGEGDISHSFGFIYKNNPYLVHSGVDLIAKKGTPVRAVNRGKIVLIAKMFRREGNMVIINHGLGIFSVYMHLSRFGYIETVQKLKNGKIRVVKTQLKEGDLVERGQIIGLTGTTGAGAKKAPHHLHYNMRNKNSYVDPIYFFNVVNKYLK